MSNELRLSTTSYAVLGLVDFFGPCTPYDLKQAIEKTLENFWPVPHTTNYVEPERLAKAGLLNVEQEPGGRRRKLYSITDSGRAALRDWVEEPTAAPPQLHDEMMVKIFCGADPAPLAAQRIQWYRDKAAELEGYLQATREAGGNQGVERSLAVGIAYTQTLGDMIDRLTGA